MKRIHIICLAAGNSTRFQCNKLLYKINGKPMYQHTAELITFLQPICGGCICVVSQYAQILSHYDGKGFVCVENLQPQEGISHSIQLGINALEQKGLLESDSIMFFVCDQPYLQKQTLFEFVREYKNTEKGIACLASGQTLGNPVVFSGKYCSELKQLSGDTGGKKVLRQHPDDVFTYNIRDIQQLSDLDYRPPHYVKCHNHKIEKISSLTLLLEEQFNPTRIVSVVGAGGKTTIVYGLAREWTNRGKKVLVTTTTHMFIPDCYYEWDGNLLHLQEYMSHNEIVTVGVRDSDTKMRGIEPSAIVQLLSVADRIVVEADGSKQLPVKVPDLHEPVIPVCADFVIGVMGYSAVGKTISMAAHRSELLCTFLGAAPNHIITLKDIVMIMQHERGLLKEVTIPFFAILNQCKVDELTKEELQMIEDKGIILCEAW